jgi:hypothetical protein
VLVCSEIRVLLAGCGWLLVADSFWEKSTAGWWLIIRANRLKDAEVVRKDKLTQLMMYSRVGNKIS